MKFIFKAWITVSLISVDSSWSSLRVEQSIHDPQQLFDVSLTATTDAAGGFRFKETLCCDVPESVIWNSSNANSHKHTHQRENENERHCAESEEKFTACAFNYNLSRGRESRASENRARDASSEDSPLTAKFFASKRKTITSELFLAASFRDLSLSFFYRNKSDRNAFLALHHFSWVHREEQSAAVCHFLAGEGVMGVK